MIDIGTGTGYPLEKLIQISKPGEVLALDYDKGYCQAAESRFSNNPEIRVVNADFNQFTTKDKYDEVFFGFSFMLMPDKIKVCFF